MTWKILTMLNAICIPEPCCFPAHLIPPEDDEVPEVPTDREPPPGFPPVTAGSEGEEQNVEQTNDTAMGTDPDFSLE